MNDSQLKVKDCIKKKPNDIGFFFVDRRIVQNKNISPEAKGYYVMIESETMDASEIPDHILKELNEVGYSIQEVK